jgi:hypothetical protein
MEIKLSETEESALAMLRANGGCISTFGLEEKEARGVFGREPGITTFKRLEKKGLCWFSEPVVDEEIDFEYSPDIYLTELYPMA